MCVCVCVTYVLLSDIFHKTGHDTRYSMQKQAWTRGPQQVMAKVRADMKRT